MATTAAAVKQVSRVIVRRVAWVGPLAIVSSVIANLCVRYIAMIVLDIPSNNRELSIPGPTISLTTVGTLGAVLVFILVARITRAPVRVFRIIAIVVLLLTFIPDFRLMSNPLETTATIGTLMFMHIVAAAISVSLLTTLTIDK